MEVLAVAEREEISDVQFQSDQVVNICRRGLNQPIGPWGRISSEQVKHLLQELYKERQRPSYTQRKENDESEIQKRLEVDHRIDFACEGSELSTFFKQGRFRVQAHWSLAGLGLTIRILRNNIPALDQLGIDGDIVDQMRSLILRRQGMALITGPTGSGKTTTLAALLSETIRNQSKHIVTIEDPIEYRLNKPEAASLALRTLVTQQEVGLHVSSFAQGLRDALRKKPNIIMVGEIRDPVTMEVALEAADTGHLVISTLHTRGAALALSRIISLFPKEKQEGVLEMFSRACSFILSQGLLPTKQGLQLHAEWFVNTDSASRTAIAGFQENPGGIHEVMRRGHNHAWNKGLSDKRQRGIISAEVYNEFAFDENSGSDK